MNEETLKEAWELFIKERELSFSSNLNPWEMFKAGFIAGTKQKLQQPVVGGPGSDVRSEGEQLPAEGQGEANTRAGTACNCILYKILNRRVCGKYTGQNCCA